MEKSQFSPLIERFLTYVRFDTQSAEGSTAAPSTEKQLRLAERLVEDLEMLGAKHARIGNGGVVYAEIPATPGAEDALPIGMIAHMDTSPDAPGENVQPQIIRYEGGDVVLNQKAGITLKPEDFPEIRKYAGEDIIFTDGTTLLGADDKAGIAAIMGMCEHLRNHPEIPHARICIGFTPDEEVARGTENFDIPLFGAAYAYTFDGGEIGTLESENFNAATAIVKIYGVGVHPGSAKDKMVNSIRLMAKFIDMLPADMSPEATCGHEGFLHPNKADCTVVESTVRILIRDHDPVRFEENR